jgi:hypothetical protein
VYRAAMRWSALNDSPERDQENYLKYCAALGKLAVACAAARKKEKK